ncbi:O-antigen ligase family protein [Amnibacterium setariae]|uniref:O-antigen ligase domain-containing protein n=1 Tax=Amnibacterium setariae TaxID=2306585 RepID=A0A3A1TUM2_9MICO|nr:O-antigen ligase family protein [Amnibacterium setariae]RIX26624.1 O-antigen ligase domain-containing protein [Amnibacterium setariae]
MVVTYPLEWALGATAFASIGFAAVMIALLLVRGRARLVPGLLPLLVLLPWVVICGIGLHSLSQGVGYVQRLGDLASAATAAVYYVNARERIDARLVMNAVVVLWSSVVLLGLVAIALPDARLTTPVSLIVPNGLLQNDLVHQLLLPPLAEVQQPWGAEQPFNRPAAPFPYANSWGAAYALLTPVVVAFLTTGPSRRVRLVLSALLVVSVYPAVQTSNRGMFLGLGIAVVYVVLRLALRGRIAAVVGASLAAAVAGAYLVLSGAVQNILERQEVSDSTGTRSDLYSATFRATLDSPFLGWASPQDDATIGYALGTQGHAWTLMYSYGFVGLALFVLFLLGVALRTAAAPTTPALLLHAVIVMAIPLMWFYGLGTVQLLVLVLVAAVLLRARSDGEELR